MRILQILPELNVGGVETGTVDFARYLRDHGHYPVVISNGGALAERLQQEGIKHYTLPVHKKFFWTARKMVKEVRRIIREERIDIVHARSRVPAWIAFFACRHTPAEFITTCHGHYSTHLLSRVMGWPRLVIVPSSAIARHMIDAFGVPAERIRCIPRSVNLERFQGLARRTSGTSSPVISIVGRITPLKGHTYFIKAMARVVRSLPYAKVWIIGDAPAKKPAYRQEVEMLVRRLGLQEHVEFLGNREDVPALMAQSDVVVMASVEPESFGRVILEAQAAGTPVVATSVGGVLDIIDDERTGLLVLPRDVDAMAAAVLRLLRDKALAKELTSAAYAKLQEEFTLDRMCGQTIAVYEELLRTQNILVIKFSAVGDVILITPSLKAIRKRFPKARIFCVVGESSRKVLQACPYIDELIVIDTEHHYRGYPGILRFARKLRKYHFDKIIDFQNNRRSHLLDFLLSPKNSYGFNKKWGKLLTDPVDPPLEDMPPVQHQFQILQTLGIPYKHEHYLELWPTRKDQQKAQELLDSEWLGNARQIVGVNISASEKWMTKNWPVEHIARLCDLLAPHNIRVIMTGTARDQDRAGRVLKLTNTKPANFAGKTDIMELAALIKRCSVYISVDSAPLHVAAAVGTPLVALFGPTFASRHMPPARQAHVFERRPTCVSPYTAQCAVHADGCLIDIQPEEVAGKVLELIGEHVP